MARPYSKDLRDRVVGSVAGGRTCRATATLFGVSEHSRSYSQFQAPELTVRSLSGPQQVAYDGEMGEKAIEFRFRKRAELTVYCCRTA